MPTTSLDRWPLLATADLILGGAEKFLRDRRKAGLSYNSIAKEMREHKIVVSAVTVRSWCVRFGITVPA